MIKEKPKNSKSDLAVTGLYFFDNKVVKYSKDLKPSKRREIDIVVLININKKYNTDIMPTSTKPKKKSKTDKKVEKKVYKDEYPHEAFGEVEKKDLPRVKKLSGPQLVRSWTEIPHVTQHDEIDITEMEQFRTTLIDNYSGDRIRISPLAFIV